MTGYLRVPKKWTLVAGIVALLGAAACKRQDPDASNPFATSLIFDDASPDARDALATPVDFRVTDENFARWGQAQDNLDQLPRSAISSNAGSGGSAIDRAVARLESSPRARRAIESAGLSVRDFVLETIALAQATQAMQPGVPASRSAIVVANSRFVSQYQARVLRSRAAYARSQNPESFEVQPGMTDDGSAGVNAQPAPIEGQPAQQIQAEQSLEAARQRQTDSALVSTPGRRPRPNPDPARDSVPEVRRDTIPDGNR
ncbi:MAG: hypothetical protein ACJ792_08325 [Gemmatimonadaceae bacterium]